MNLEMRLLRETFAAAGNLTLVPPLAFWALRILVIPDELVRRVPVPVAETGAERSSRIGLLLPGVARSRRALCWTWSSPGLNCFHQRVNVCGESWFVAHTSRARGLGFWSWHGLRRLVCRWLMVILRRLLDLLHMDPVSVRVRMPWISHARHVRWEYVRSRHWSGRIRSWGIRRRITLVDMMVVWHSGVAIPVRVRRVWHHSCHAWLLVRRHAHVEVRCHEPPRRGHRRW